MWPQKLVKNADDEHQQHSCETFSEQKFSASADLECIHLVNIDVERRFREEESVDSDCFVRSYVDLSPEFAYIRFEVPHDR